MLSAKLVTISSGPDHCRCAFYVNKSLKVNMLYLRMQSSPIWSLFLNPSQHTIPFGLIKKNQRLSWCLRLNLYIEMNILLKLFVPIHTYIKTSILPTTYLSHFSEFPKINITQRIYNTFILLTFLVNVQGNLLCNTKALKGHKDF